MSAYGGAAGHGPRGSGRFWWRRPGDLGEVRGAVKCDGFLKFTGFVTVCTDTICSRSDDSAAWHVAGLAAATDAELAAGFARIEGNSGPVPMKTK